MTSLSFVSPIADTLQYTMLSTGLTLNFGVALVVGVLSGSVLTAVLTGRFKLEGYTSPSHMVRSISGAALMGIGGAMAYGCSIGQGLTACRRWECRRSSRLPESCRALRSAFAARSSFRRWQRANGNIRFPHVHWNVSGKWLVLLTALRHPPARCRQRPSHYESP